MMQKILKFTQFPPGPVPEGYIYYNRQTREIKLNTDIGEQKFGATYIPTDIDALSINGYYPLYRNETLAKQVSPTSSSTLYNESNLGVPAPDGVTYPLYMPVGVGTYLGNHIDPGGDDDGDGILNFRDPDVAGLTAMPSAGYKGIDPFVTSGGSSVLIKRYLTNPDQGTFNETEKNVLVSVGSSGIIVGPNGEIEYFFGPGAAVIKPGWSLFEDEGSSSSPLPEPTPAYNGQDPFLTSTGQTVNIKDYIDNPDNGSYNNSGQPITVNVTKPGIMVCADGSIDFFFPGAVSIGVGCTMFLDRTADSTSPLPEPSPAYTTDPFLVEPLTSSSLSAVNHSGVDPFTTSNNVDVNILDYITTPGGGFLNTSSSDVTISVDDSGILVGPNGEIKVFLGPGATVVPAGWVVFEDIGSTDSPLPEPSPAYTGTDPFETSGGSQVNIKEFLSLPDTGSHNDTGTDITIDCTLPGMVVCDDGSFTLSLPGTVNVSDGCTFFKDEGGSTTPLPGPSTPYTGVDPFVTSTGVDVNIKSYLDDPDSGSHNSTGQPIELQVTEDSIIVAPDGTVTVVTPIPTTVTLPDGHTLFSNKSSLSSHSDDKQVNIGDFLENPDKGSFNHTLEPLTIQITEPAIIIGPNGEITVFSPPGEEPPGGEIQDKPSSPVPGTYVLGPGCVIFSEVSTFIKKSETSTVTPPDLSDSSAESLQWFEESNGDLVLRDSIFSSSSPAIQLWESSGEDYLPRNEGLSSNTDSAQFFQLTTEGDVIPNDDHTSVSDNPINFSSQSSGS